MNHTRVLDPKRIAKLESAAARDPAAYRRRVALLSVFGDATLTAALVLPIALPILIGLAFFPYQYFFWIGGIALVFFIWVVRPSPRFSAREVKPDEAPALHDAIRDLQQKLNMPGSVSVALDESFNAAAVEGKSFFGFGAKRTLLLGVPLLCALSRDQVLAIVAHEFGHFSRRHGALGHWIYRARVGWLHYAEQSHDDDSAFEKAATLFAEWFVPMFSSYSFVLARRCEYEADADAAFALGAPAVADALVQVHVKGAMWHEMSAKRTRDWQRDMPEPPEGMHALWSREARGADADEERRLLDRELAEPSGLLDTHPSLADRLAAMQSAGALDTSHGPCAGEAFFGEKWTALSAEFDRNWRSAALPGWRFAHFRFKYLVQPLLDDDAAAEAPAPSGAHASSQAERGVEAMLARAHLLMDDKPEEVKTALTALRRDHPDHAGICFALAKATLPADPDAAADLLRKAARLDATYEVPACRLLIAMANARSLHADAEKHRLTLQRALKPHRAAGERFALAIEMGKFAAPSLDANALAVMRESLRGTDAVVQGWILEKRIDSSAPNAADDAPSARQSGYCVVLRIDPEKGGSISDEIGDQSLAELSSLVSPNALVLSRVIFTTETMPSALEKAFAADPAYCCFRRE